jgi:hypothetical protein
VQRVPFIVADPLPTVLDALGVPIRRALAVGEGWRAAPQVRALAADTA